jgi:hypothetical protein
MLRMRRSTVQAVAAFIGIAVLVVLSGWLGFSTFEMTRSLTPERAAEWTHLVLFLVWLMLVMMPVIGFAGNEFYDITKLFVLPLSQRTVFTAQALGMLASGTTLFFVPALVGLVAGLPGGAPALCLRLLALLLLLFHAQALAQLLQLLFLNLLRSRRFRDLVPVVAALLSGGIYLSFRLLGAAEHPAQWIESVLDRGLSGYLSMLPVDWLAGVVAPDANGPAVVVFLVAFLPFTVLTVVVAAVLQERAFYGDLGAPPPERTHRESGSRAGSLPIFRRIPNEIRAIARKELQTIRREPVVKALFIQQFVFVLVPVGFAVASSPDPGQALSYAHYAFLFVESVLALNLLGLEGAGIAALLATPIRRRRILWGKVLANLLLWGVLNLFLLAFVVAIATLFGMRPGGFAIATLVAEQISGLLVLLGLGSLVSIVVPVPIGARGRRALSRGQGNEGCLSALSRLVAMLVLTLLMLPVILICRLAGPGWPVLLTPAYGAALLWLGVRVGSRSLEGREEFVIAALARSRD